jgi:predicted dienelactone hydrolase/ABC-type amino acid transport substrate-binding protein
VGKVVRYTPNRNGFYGLRAAIVGAAAQAGAQGWTLLDVIEQFPGTHVEVKVQDLLKLRQVFNVYLDYSQATVAAIETKAQAEAEASTDFDFTRLSDLSQPGPYDFEEQTITVTNPALRQTEVGLSVNYDFSVDVYLPQGLSEPAPVMIISHGFGSVKENFIYIAEHLASYGFVVLVPDHIGSDLSYRQTYLSGRLNTLLSPVEFLNRPQDISFLIDQLEELVASNTSWANLLNLEQIGVMGDSLGATTVLSLAGAEINHARLAETCHQDNVILNASLYLQCRAQHLPPENFNLKDARIKAVLSAHPLTSGIFGPEGMSQIDIPLLITAGSQDVVAPAVTEQIHPFIWLASEQPKHLVLFEPGSHFITSEQTAEGAETIPSFLLGQHQELGRQYFKSLNVAFFEAYLRNRAEFLPYLSSSYAQAVSQGQPLDLNVIQSLTPEDLETAYGNKVPIPIVPELVEITVAAREESIVSEIQRTGVLKVAMRRDTPFFGELDYQKQWTGYCPDLAVALQNYLNGQLGTESEIELVELPSTLDNRFSLIQENTVHLECGPNTIRQDLEGIAFSDPIVATGTRFFYQRERQDEINPNLSLEDVKIGVLEKTTTAEFLETSYPQANLIYFGGLQGRTEAIDAVEAERIDAFASDTILLIGEMARQNLPVDEYLVQPRQPLTCDFYGLMLPNDDPDWLATINEFIAEPAARQVMAQWFEQTIPLELNDLEYCFNR